MSHKLILIVNRKGCLTKTSHELLQHIKKLNLLDTVGSFMRESPCWLYRFPYLRIAGIHNFKTIQKRDDIIEYLQTTPVKKFETDSIKKLYF